MSNENRLRDALRHLAAEEPPEDLVARSVTRLPPRRTMPRLYSFTVSAGGAALVIVSLVALVLSAPKPPNSQAGASPDSSPSQPHEPAVADATLQVPTASAVESSISGQGSPAPTLEVPSTQVVSEPTIDALSDKERSDRFWGEVTDFARYAFTYESLAEITRDVHLIVRGRVTGFKEGGIETFSGEPLGSYTTVFGIVTVDDVLKGSPISRSGGTIEVANLGWPEMTEADLPGDDVILFLMNYAQLRQEQSAEPSEDADDRYYYGRANGYQGALRSVDGSTIDVIEGPVGWENALGPFPAGLDGERVSEIVTRIREFAAE